MDFDLTFDLDFSTLVLAGRVCLVAGSFFGAGIVTVSVSNFTFFASCKFVPFDLRFERRSLEPGPQMLVGLSVTAECDFNSGCSDSSSFSSADSDERDESDSAR